MNSKNKSLESVEKRIKSSLYYYENKIGLHAKKNGLLSKRNIRAIHKLHREEKLKKASCFLKAKLANLKNYIANGSEVLPARISPFIEVVKAGTKESDLFRLATLTWSVPVSEGYGRRIRFLVWDNFNGKLIGVFALGDPVFNLKVRDEVIGWNADDRKERLVNVMDAYVLGALPPYNMLLGGKLVASLIRTKEVRDIFFNKYGQSSGIISGKKKKPRLLMVTTTSSLGRSSIYNRLKYGEMKYYESVGYTSGYGHFHVPNKLFKTILDYLERKKHSYVDNYHYGGGPNWRLRAIRSAFDLLRFNGNVLKHGIKREVFICRFANNADQILRGERKRPDFSDLLSLDEVSRLVSERWIIPRAIRKPEYSKWKRWNITRLIKK